MLLGFQVRNKQVEYAISLDSEENRKRHYKCEAIQ